MGQLLMQYDTYLSYDTYTDILSLRHDSPLQVFNNTRTLCTRKILKTFKAV